MHHCLLVAEILDNIFGFVAVAKPDRTMPLRPQPVYWARLDRACKAFSSPALDQLWSSLYSIDPILRLLPDGTWRKTKGSDDENDVVLLRALTAEDWISAEKYTRRVRSLHIVASSRVEEILEVIHKSIPVLPVCPGLRCLRWVGSPERIGLFTRHLSLRLELYERDVGNWDLDVLRPIIDGGALAGVEDLEIALYAPNVGILHPGYATLFRHLPRLKKLFSETLSQQTFSTALCLPVIERIEIPSPGLNTWTRHYPALTPSTTLNAIHLAYTTVEFVTKFLENASSRRALKELCFANDSLNTSSTMARFYDTLATRSDPQRLQTLSFRYTEDNSATEPPENGLDAYVVKGSQLRTLFRFINLQTVTLMASAGFELDDATMKDLTLAWPRLVKLELCSATDVEVRPVTTGRSLLHIARNCPALERLVLPMDLTTYAHSTAGAIPTNNIPAFESYRDARPVQKALTSLNVCTSPIEYPNSVAQFLTSIFPSLKRVEVAAKADWIRDLVDGDELFAENAAAQDWYEIWDQVDGVMSAFQAARAEERYCADLGEAR
ncbi:hypothetical protein MKEN_00188700 [Mycena kentingensis (nom. inval.)]|nr:hypothetical protein MKEN_00188700 [Mycena kentingensis (nom. inval.)]